MVRQHCPVGFLGQMYKRLWTIYMHRVRCFRVFFVCFFSFFALFSVYLDTIYITIIRETNFSPIKRDGSAESAINGRCRWTGDGESVGRRNNGKPAAKLLQSVGATWLPSARVTSLAECNIALDTTTIYSAQRLDLFAWRVLTKPAPSRFSNAL